MNAVDHQRLKSKAHEAKAYCVSKGFSTNYCFLVDFSIHSGKKRFFVWDFKGDSIKYASLCAHGYGKDSTPSKPVLAIRREVFALLWEIQSRYSGLQQWGINVHYKLHGLEPTNDNAFKRIVVLHSYTPLPATEVYPSHLPLGMSQGCPVICNETMRQIDVLLKAETKPVLLWIYND